VNPLRANQAVRLGLRAASRNPELAFGKALIDLVSTVLSLLPVFLAAALLFGVLSTGDLIGYLRGMLAVTWPVVGALVTVAALSFIAGAAFWAGAVPILAADAEMGGRPPRGAFTRLVSSGFARVLSASVLALLLSAAFGIGVTAAIIAGTVLLVNQASPELAAGVAFAIALAVIGGLMLDQLARLTIARAAALGEGAVKALSGAARLLGERLGAVIGVAFAFFILELIVSAASSAIGGSISASASLDPDTLPLAVAPRVALWIATAVVLAWLEVGRQGALGMIAANDAGLLEPPEPEPEGPRRPSPVPTVLERPAETVIEALPVAEEPVIEALPVAEEPVVEALPAPEPEPDANQEEAPGKKPES
jgi:hypothetical protein